MGTAQIPADLKFSRGELITASKLNEIASYLNSVKYYDSGNVESDYIYLYIKTYGSSVSVAKFHGESARMITPYPTFNCRITRLEWDVATGEWGWKEVYTKEYDLAFLFDYNYTHTVAAWTEGWYRFEFWIDGGDSFHLETWMQILNACFPTDNKRGDYLVSYHYPTDPDEGRYGIGKYITAETLNEGGIMTSPTPYLIYSPGGGVFSSSGTPAQQIYNICKKIIEGLNTSAPDVIFRCAIDECSEAAFVRIVRYLDSSGNPYRITAEFLDEDRNSIMLEDYGFSTVSYTGTVSETGPFMLGWQDDESYNGKIINQNNPSEIHLRLYFVPDEQ